MKSRWVYRTARLVACAALLAPFSSNWVTAQDGRALLREWLTTQRQAIRSVANVEVNERTVLSVDVGFGRQILEMDALRTVAGGDAPGGRAVRRVTLNGTEIAPEAGERFRRRQRGLWRPEFGRIVDGFRFPVQDFARMQVVGQVSQEDRDGILMWRVETVPQARPDPIERISAWYDHEEFHLRATQTVLRGPGPTVVRIQTSYERIEGIDLPVRIRVDGTSRMQRRMRSFQSFIELEVDYANYRLTLNRP